MRLTKAKRQKLAGMADELAIIRAQRDMLDEREDIIKKDIRDSGLQSVLGARFEAYRVESNRNDVDWKAVAAKLNPSRQLVSAHTKPKLIVSIRTRPRKGMVA